MINPYPPDSQTQMARQRNRLAADRSLLSFTRNSLTLISTGVGLDSIVAALQPEGAPTSPFIHSLTLVFIAQGVLSLIFACLDYSGELQRLQQEKYLFTPRLSLGGFTGSSILIAGTAAFFWILTKN